MNTRIAEELLDKYQAGTCTPDERLAVELWFESLESHAAELDAAGKHALAEQIKHQIDLRTGNGIQVSNKKPATYKLYLAIAAAVATITLGVWLYYSSGLQTKTPRHPELVSGSPQIAPGGNRATLTVNGKQMQLSDAMTGVVVGNDVRYNDGSVVKGSSLPSGISPQAGERIQTLTVQTPRGGTYQVTLSDGTKVWLNADSKLEFISNFWNQAQRIVRLTGEAYFEAATAYTSLRGQRTKQPFIVQSNGQSVTVLGTHFNISAYDGEAIKTTLLEGSVRIASLSASGGEKPEGREVVLKPNQQSLIAVGNNEIKVTAVIAEDAISWKNGTFTFNNEPLAQVMQKIARWYNVTITYQTESLKTQNVYGTISRFSNIEDIIHLLELTGTVKITTAQNKLIVAKN